MLAEIDADGSQRFEVEILNIGRRRLQDDLKLHVLEQAVGVLAVTAVCRATRGLHIADAVRSGAKDTQKSFWRHGSGADLNVIGLLEDATVFGPEGLEPQ